MKHRPINRNKDLKKDCSLNRNSVFWVRPAKLLLFSCLFLLLLFVPALKAVFSNENAEDMPHHEVEHWAQLIGNHIFHLMNTVAKYSEIEENFRNMDATISENDGLTLVKQMALDVSNMMKYKVQAVKRIMNVAEEVSQDPSYLSDEWKGYYNAKIVNQPTEHVAELEDRYGSKLGEYYGSRLKELYTTLDMAKNTHFDGMPISLNLSTVHVATNVFEGKPSVIRAIRWSEALDKTFHSNYEHDPTLSWQYFGSSTGFLRQFPGASWQMEADDPDMYDARLRSWYIQAANSPKDMVILLDVSGSMTGLRKEISKHVVLNILETLTNNDYVNVFTFSEETIELVPCFKNTLVQANLENLGEFKLALDNVETANIANFSTALTTAFTLLKNYKKDGHGSQCNQAIMLVTDGAPYKYDNIFKEYNWPQLQTRVFTYLIGREVTEVRTLSWMACANNGYFVHVTTPSEVREQVLKYIPVVARPMVMYQDKHPIVWTGVYADVADPRQTNWLWELRERERQMRRTKNYRELKRIIDSRDSVKYQWVMNDNVEVEKFLTYGKFDLSDRQIARLNAEYAKRIRGRRKHGYVMMISVSVPVYNRTQVQERVSDLLGVAGTDLPIKEIQKLVPAYKLGVNGYSFMVNKNGYILYHPDLRPTFQDILKPNYNSVDLAEIELLDVSDDPRYNHSELKTLRRDMIEQRSSETSFKVRVHLDNMKRVEVRTQRYYTSKVSETPFSLGIALPDDYGRYKVVGQIELSLAMKDNFNFNASDLFKSGNWSLHPDWVYCEYKYDQGQMRTPEELMIHFLQKAQMPGWKWRSTRTRPPPDSTQNKGHQAHYDERDYYCDKNLVQSLLFDAKATDVFNKPSQKNNFVDSNNLGKHKDFGITSAFVSTRSGLSRWTDITDDLPNSEDEPHFMKIHNRGIDEVWYKRAVNYYKEDPEAYVYSVPFDSASRDPRDVHVTASRAIFIKQNRFRQAPAAVVGVNVRLDKFVEFFTNETFNCREYSRRQPSCKKDMTCKSEFLDCYLLDDNGFVVASEKTDQSGKFFGEIEGTIMESLVQSDVYNRVKIHDYQAVCLDVTSEGSFASILLTPIQMLKWLLNWFMSNFMWLMLKTQIYHLWNPNEAWVLANEELNPPVYDSRPPRNQPDVVLTDDESSFDGMDEQDLWNQPINEDEPTFPKLQMAYINKTRPRPCDKSTDLYKLNNNKLKESKTNKFKPVKGKLSNCHSNGCGRPFSVQKVIKTNMVLIVVHNLCPCESRTVSIEPVEVPYNETEHCERLLQQNFRERPANCHKYHPDEASIKACGGCGFIPVFSSILILGLTFCRFFSIYFNVVT